MASDGPNKVKKGLNWALIDPKFAIYYQKGPNWSQMASKLGQKGSKLGSNGFEIGKMAKQGPISLQKAKKVQIGLE